MHLNDTRAMFSDAIALLRADAEDRDEAAKAQDAQVCSQIIVLCKVTENRDAQRASKMISLHSAIDSLRSEMTSLREGVVSRDAQRASEMIALQSEINVLRSDIHAGREDGKAVIHELSEKIEKFEAGIHRDMHALREESKLQDERRASEIEQLRTETKVRGKEPPCKRAAC